MRKGKFDFSGWATKNDLRCADGRTIRKNAFKDDDGRVVPLVWQHQHNDPENVLGHAVLENREDGVYTYCSFNDTYPAKQAKQLVQHGDICSLSIYANQLKQNGGDVLHGSIKEVSLVLAGANPGAMIDFPILEHGEESETEAYIFTGVEEIFFNCEELQHADSEDKEEKESGKEDAEMNKEDSGKTVQDVLDTFNEEQKKVLDFLIGKALESKNEDSEEAEHSDEEGDDFDMKHNVFDSDNNAQEKNVLTHSQMETIIGDAKRYGSMRDSVLAHSAEYGIDQIDWLFPDYKNLDNPPAFISRDMGWVQKVMGGVHHTPFSRIKSMFADLTEDEARALGYIKGNLKKNEVFTLLRRTTDPQTIYKHQKLDRDDVVDITNFDVVSWLKGEMRMMLDEEIARAILVGDGRETSSNDHISEDHVRSIFRDNSTYVIRKTLTEVQGEAPAKTFIKQVIRSWKEYKGSGNCTMFCTEDLLSELLLLEDGMGHFMYQSAAQLATVLRVKEIVTVPVMSATTTVRASGDDTFKPMAIIVNLNDYNVGADKGGSVNMFDDFDIDYNQQKYLIETRCSGALIKPYSAIIIEEEADPT